MPGARARGRGGTEGPGIDAQAARWSVDQGPAAGERLPATDRAPDMDLLPEDVEDFWRGRRTEGGPGAAATGEAGGDDAVAGVSSSASASGAKASTGLATGPSGSARAMLASLSRPRIWRGEEDLEEVLLGAYDAAAELAVALLARDTGGAEGEEEGDGEEPVGQGDHGPALGKPRSSTGRSTAGEPGAPHERK